MLFLPIFHPPRKLFHAILELTVLSIEKNSVLQGAYRYDPYLHC